MAGKKEASGGKRIGAGRKARAIKINVGDVVTIDGVLVGRVAHVEHGLIMLQAPDGRAVRMDITQVTR